MTERKDLKIVVMSLEFCLIPRVYPSPWICTGPSGVGISTCPSCSSDSHVWALHCRGREGCRSLADEHVLSITVPSGRTPLPSLRSELGLSSRSPGLRQAGWPMALQPGRCEPPAGPARSRSGEGLRGPGAGSRPGSGRRRCC